ncbi:calvin cycle protein CP12-2, chloroplastic-like [Asparagus officinalis]|nr:calvin cycle protein CP12-2, chloroplastic-like [Asparagus officinalis]
MAAALSGVSLSTPRGVISSKSEIPKAPKRSLVSWNTKIGYGAGRMVAVQPVHSTPTPSGISGKVEESIEKAKEACAGDNESGECAAAWDEVEELSAAASHARDKAKDSDPLEAYCKDNPETDECRTYED